MKKLVLTTLLAIAVSSVAIAQHAPRSGGMKMMQMHQQDNFTPEQRATLKAKKLTLALELSDKQQKELEKLFSEEGKMMQKHHQKMKADKEAGKEVNRYDMMNEHMDLQIDHQRKIKNILNEDQYAKWSKMKMHQGMKKAPKGKMMMHQKAKIMHKGATKDHQCIGDCKMEGKGHKKGAMYQNKTPMRR